MPWNTNVFLKTFLETCKNKRLSTWMYTFERTLHPEIKRFAPAGSAICPISYLGWVLYFWRCLSSFTSTGTVWSSNCCLNTVTFQKSWLSYYLFIASQTLLILPTMIHVFLVWGWPVTFILTGSFKYRVFLLLEYVLIVFLFFFHSFFFNEWFQLKSKLTKTLSKLETEENERQKVAGDLYTVRILVYILYNC